MEYLSSLRLLGRFRQIKQETPYRDHSDGPTGGRDQLVLVSGHDGGRLEVQLGHRLTQRRSLALSRLRFGKGFAHLYQYSGAASHRDDEINLPAGLCLVIVDRRMKTPKRCEDEILQEMAGVHENTR